MASGTSEIVTTYILKLSQEELNYLSKLTRDYLGEQPENEKDRLIRLNIYDTLKEIDEE